MNKIAKYISFGTVSLVALYAGILSAPLSHAATAPTVSFGDIYGPYGVEGGNISVNGGSSGPFTQDFRVTMCLNSTLPDTQNNYPPRPECTTTQWASQAAVPGNSQYQTYSIPNSQTWWSPWVGQGQNDPYWNDGTPTITVDTRPLPAGDVLTNVQLGIQFADANGGIGTLPDSYVCNSYQAGYISQQFTPIGGGASGVSYGYTSGNCDPANISQKPNFFRLYISASNYNAAAASNNVPTAFTASQNKSIGNDGQPLQISVMNTGNTAWTMNNSTIISGSAVGTCDNNSNLYSCPDLSQPQNTACTTQINNWSNIFQLPHISGSFAVANNPAQVSHTSTVTCSVGPMGCTTLDSDPACQTDQNTCESAGYCVNGQGGALCGDPAGCTMDPSLGGCGGTEWVTCNGTWEPQYQISQSNSSVQPGQTGKFLLSSMSAPALNGNYTEVWQMMSSDGAFNGNFGPQIPITISVTGGAATTTVTSVTVTCSPTSIDVSQTSQCTATVNGTGGPAQTVTWSATDGTIDPTGLFTPDSPGTAVITAASTVDPAVTGGTNVTVLGGTITVSSENSVQQSSPVAASWSITGFDNPCDGTHGGYCSNVQNATYLNNPNGIYTINPLTSFSPTLYVFNSVKEFPVAAQTNNLNSGLMAFVKNIAFPSAEAFSFPPSNPQVQSITNNTTTINFVILWDPVADIALSQATLSPSATTGAVATSVISISNDGAPGSNLTWTASSDSSWLTASPSSNNAGLAQGTSENITITSNSSGLSLGNQTGTITFTGMSTIDDKPVVSRTLTVSFNVTSPGNGNGGNGGNGGNPTCGGANGPCATCSFSSNVSTIVVPQSATLSYNCQNVSACTLSGGSVNTNLNANASSTISGITSVSPSATTVYTLSCNGSNGGSISNTVQVNVGNSLLCESNPGGTNCPQ